VPRGNTDFFVPICLCLEQAGKLAAARDAGLESRLAQPFVDGIDRTPGERGDALCSVSFGKQEQRFPLGIRKPRKIGDPAPGRLHSQIHPASSCGSGIKRHARGHYKNIGQRRLVAGDGRTPA
jgi:hypothetical protein